MGDTDDKFCTIYIIVTILLNHYLLRGGYVSNSSLYNVGSVGYYWSSTPYSSNNAYILLFSSNTITACGLHGSRPRLLCPLRGCWVVVGGQVVATSPLYFVRNGYVAPGSSYLNVAGGGYYWSSHAYSTSYAYGLYLNPSYVGPSPSSHRYFGYSMRCVAGWE